MGRCLAILVLMLLVTCTAVSVASTDAKADTTAISTTPTVPSTNVTDVIVGIYVNALGSFDFGKGLYSLDFYLWFVWTDPTIHSMNFEIMNGQPAYSGSIQKISDDTNGTVKSQWFRIRADLFIPPNLKDYPFESGGLKVELEDADLNNTRLQYQWNVAKSSYDPASVVIPGWRVPYLNYSVTEHTYSFGETYSQATFVMQVERNSLPAAIQISPAAHLLSGLQPLVLLPPDQGIEHRSEVGPELQHDHLGGALLLRAAIDAALDELVQPLRRAHGSVYVFLGLTIAVTVLGVVGRRTSSAIPEGSTSSTGTGRSRHWSPRCTVFVLLETFNV